MAKRVPASMRTRESLSDLFEGHLSSADGRAALVKLATRLIVEEALEAESRGALGRDYYEHGGSPGQGWRNGVRTGRLKTAEGFVDYGGPFDPIGFDEARARFGMENMARRRRGPLASHRSGSRRAKR